MEICYEFLTHLGSEKPTRSEFNDELKTVVVQQLYEFGIQKLEDELERFKSMYVISILHSYVHMYIDMCVSVVYVYVYSCISM